MTVPRKPVDSKPVAGSKPVGGKPVGDDPPVVVPNREMRRKSGWQKAAKRGYRRRNALKQLKA